MLDCPDHTAQAAGNPNAFWIVDQSGAIFAELGAAYLDGLNEHPEWNPDPNTPWDVVGLRPFVDPANGDGYTIVTRFPGNYGTYSFPRSRPYKPAGA